MNDPKPKTPKVVANDTDENADWIKTANPQIARLISSRAADVLWFIDNAGMTEEDALHRIEGTSILGVRAWKEVVRLVRQQLEERAGMLALPDLLVDNAHELYEWLLADPSVVRSEAPEDPDDAFHTWEWWLGRDEVVGHVADEVDQLLSLVEDAEDHGMNAIRAEGIERVLAQAMQALVVAGHQLATSYPHPTTSAYNKLEYELRRAGVQRAYELLEQAHDSLPAQPDNKS